METLTQSNETLQKIYDSEINFTIETFWDGGITFKLGDKSNGWKAESTFRNFDKGVVWLAEQVRQTYPDSDFTHLNGAVLNVGSRKRKPVEGNEKT